VKRNTDRILTVSGVQPGPGGTLSAKATTLKDLIISAYQIKQREIFGGPAWIESERYDIEAKASEPVGWDSGLRPMLKTLLADKFQLRVHTESREMPVYTLTVAKSGAKLKRLEEECTPGADGHCGGYVTRIGQITGQKVSMAQLADTLSAIMDRPVIDKTSLVGFCLSGCFRKPQAVVLDACLVRRFRRRCVNFKRSSPPKKLARSTWLPAAGRMVSFVPDVGSGEAMNWRNGDVGSAPIAGIKFR